MILSTDVYYEEIRGASPGEAASLHVPGPFVNGQCFARPTVDVLNLGCAHRPTMNTDRFQNLENGIGKRRWFDIRFKTPTIRRDACSAEPIERVNVEVIGYT